MIAQDRARACCSAEARLRRGRRTAEPLRGGFGWVAESGFPEGGPGGWGWRGRRESVPGGLAAPSMARIPRQPHPPGPRQIPAADPPREINNKSKSGSLRSQSRARQPTAIAVAVAFSLDLPVVGTGGRKLSTAGWVGGAGVSAPWMARLSPHGWVYGVPRPAYPPGQTHEPSFQRPTHPTTEGLRRSPTLAEGALSAEEKKFPTDVSIPSPLVRCTQ